MPKEIYNILLADDHTLMMDGLEKLFNDLGHFNVGVKCNSLETVRDALVLNKIDLVVCDYSLGADCGADVVQFVKETYPLLKIIMLTMHHDPHIIHECMSAGADGYFLKSVNRSEITRGITDIFDNKTYIQIDLLPAYRNYKHLHADAKTDNKLSAREVQIIQLVLAGKSTLEISEELKLSEFTVKTHRKNIGRKTDAKTPLALAAYVKLHNIRFK